MHARQINSAACAGLPALQFCAHQATQATDDPKLVRTTGEIARVDFVRAQILNPVKTDAQQPRPQRRRIEKSAKRLARRSHASHHRSKRQSAKEAQ